MTFTTHKDVENRVGKVEPEYKYVLGPGVRTRWPLGTEVTLSLCSPDFSENTDVLGRHLWNEALGDSLKINFSVLETYPPFSDLNHHCIYVVHDFYKVNPENKIRLLPAETFTLANPRTQNIFDADIFVYESELNKVQLTASDLLNSSFASRFMTHEIGHFLGLDHMFEDDVKSIMSYDTENKNQLYSYDFKAIQKEL
ncbi:MAG: matrixin family metalloprotease [Bdellovibrionales bacterium]